MAQFETKNNKKLTEELSYVFPESEKITIDKANLQIQLDKFKSAVISTFSFDSFISLLITLSAVWIPLFTSDFISVGGLSASTIKSIYIGFSSLVTLYVFFKYILLPLHFLIFKQDTASSNSERMAQIILDKCNKK